jgi:RHS repeat-associated protein
VAGEVTSFVSGGGTESRSYNANGQLTTLSLPGRTIAYNYPAAGLNNGKIESMTESGETVVYAYDSLQRLTSATGSGWAQTYQYDVFGNLYNKQGSGSAPTWSGSIDPATNRLTGGVSYDANGNQTNVPLIAGSEMPDALSSLIYDVSNRLIRAENNGATRRGEYDYDPGNKRVYEKRSVNSAVVGEWAYFFGITGQRLGRYSFTVSGTSIAFSQAQASVWFGGKLVQKFEGAAVSWASEDRLGSVGKYLPYGEAKPGASNPAGDNEKFATYTRDSGTGLDYADQRWHVAGSGRFLTSDPYQASGGAGDPGSWNRFGYVRGEPIHRVDPRGLADCPYNTCVTVSGSNGSGGSGPGVGGSGGVSLSGLGGGGGDDMQSIDSVGHLSEPASESSGDDLEPMRQMAEQLRAGIEAALNVLANSEKCKNLFATSTLLPVLGLSASDLLTRMQSGGLIDFGAFWPRPEMTSGGLVINYVPFAQGEGAVRASGAGALLLNGNQVSIGKIVVNSGGFYFTGLVDGKRVQDIPGSGFAGLNHSQMQAAVLLHELGHASGIFGADKGPGIPSGASQTNSQTIRRNCF